MCVCDILREKERKERVNTYVKLISRKKWRYIARKIYKKVLYTTNKIMFLMSLSDKNNEIFTVTRRD